MFRGSRPMIEMAFPVFSGALGAGWIVFDDASCLARPAGHAGDVAALEGPGIAGTFRAFHSLRTEKINPRLVSGENPG